MVDTIIGIAGCLFITTVCICGSIMVVLFTKMVVEDMLADEEE